MVAACFRARLPLTVRHQWGLVFDRRRHPADNRWQQTGQKMRRSFSAIDSGWAGLGG